MNIVITDHPEMNMVDIRHFRKFFNRGLNLIEGYFRRCPLHKYMNSFGKQLITFLYDNEPD